MHVKTYSDVTSTTGIIMSPSQTPPSGGGGGGQVYYVQSPSLYGETTPAGLSPMRSISPPTYNHSRSSSLPEKTWFSGPPAGKVTTPTSHHVVNGRNDHQYRQQGVEKGGERDHQFEAITEEKNQLLWEEDDDDEKEDPVLRRCRCVIAFVVGFVLLFTFFSLILWGASKNQKPIVTMKSIKFENFDVQAGADYVGVPTSMATMNATVRLVYRNKGTFFGIHVSPTIVNLYYQRLVIASGTVDRFYQGRKSQRSIVVQIGGDSIPMYGAGSNLSSNNSAPTLPIPVTLNFQVRSRAYVLGKLVKPKFIRSISCNVTMNPLKMNKPLPLKDLCIYH